MLVKEEISETMTTWLDFNLFIFRNLVEKVLYIFHRTDIISVSFCKSMPFFTRVTVEYRLLTGIFTFSVGQPLWIIYGINFFRIRHVRHMFIFNWNCIVSVRLSLKVLFTLAAIMELL